VKKLAGGGIIMREETRGESREALGEATKMRHPAGSLLAEVNGLNNLAWRV
jgi:hypothetical protein